MARKKPGKVGESKSPVVRDMPVVSSDERAAVEFMEEQRWGDHPCCPRCGDTDVYQVKDRETGERNKDYRWRCRGCGKVHTVRAGTVMAETRIPLGYWCYAFWQVCASKKGISAKQIERQTGLSYKSALFLMHRIRFAMADMEGVKLTGTVEVDESMQYRTIGREYAGHESVRHSSSEYVRGDVTTNTIESFFAILKRGLNGVYHNVSRKHLHRYLAEFDFRYNTRGLEDGGRTVAAIRGAVGKRLLYREPRTA